MKKQVLSSAQDLMREFYEDFNFEEAEKPSMEWVVDFMKRNGLSNRNNHSLEKERSQNANVKIITEWFRNVYTEDEAKKYKSYMIGNLDETMLVARNNLVCVVKRGSRFAITQEDDIAEHVTMLACVTADGQKVPPYLIFPLKTLPTTLDSRVKNKQLYVGGQAQGWITKENFKEYTKVLIEFVKNHRIRHAVQENEPFLLFSDSHNSREDPETLKSLKENFITLLTYPAHCTHILQPLDVGIFAEFKKHFKLEKRKISKQKIEFTDKTPSERSLRRTIAVLACLEALHICTTDLRIEKAFKYTGLLPRDENMALKNPRINKDETIVIPNKKRKAIDIVGKVATNDTLIQNLEMQQLQQSQANSKPKR